LSSNLLDGAVISDFTSGMRKWAFQIRIDCPDVPNHVHIFACNSEQERDKWKDVLERVAGGDIQAKICSGSLMVHHCVHLQLHVANHRKHIEHTAGEHFEPFFRSLLWKLKIDGDPLEDSHWFRRDTWLSKNGTLAYWSERENQELIHFGRMDMLRLSVRKVSNKDSAKAWAICLSLPPCGDLEFSPSLFAAESLEQREEWLQAFCVFTRFAQSTFEKRDSQAFPLRSSINYLPPKSVTKN
jgi:hypothetical protein